jgi:hypothetical protein
MTGARLAIRTLGLVVALGVAACSDSPTSPTDSEDAPITTPVTVTFTGVVGPGGTASRSFTAQFAGTAVASVGAINPATALGVGLGIPRADGTGCLLARSATATDGAAAQITARVDAGLFCAQVFAPSPAADAVSFTVTLEHP